MKPRAVQLDYFGWLSTDGDIVVVRVLANGPRDCPPESLVIGGPAEGVTLATLEEITQLLRVECDWRLGHEEEIVKRGGGIGASGATVLSLIFGVVGTVPTVQSLLSHLGRGVPDPPPREEALDTAIWAVAMQYDTVARRSLELVGEVREVDHWSFGFRLPESNDRFEVDIYGSRHRTFATRIVWSKGHPEGHLPRSA